jgi:hypothetical protein
LLQKSVMQLTLRAPRWPPAGGVGNLRAVDVIADDNWPNILRGGLVPRRKGTLTTVVLRLKIQPTTPVPRALFLPAPADPANEEDAFIQNYLRLADTALKRFSQESSSNHH